MVKMVISEVQQQTADIQAFCKELIEALTEVVEATQSVTLIDSWKGKVADSMKDYLGRVYPAACRAVMMFTEEYAEANQTYLNAYISRFGAKDTDSDKLEDQLRRCEQMIRNCEAEIEHIEQVQRSLSIAERTTLRPLYREALETNYQALERNYTMRDTVQKRLDDFMAFDAHSPSYFEGLGDSKALMHRALGALGINVQGEVERSNWNGNSFSGYNTNWIPTVNKKWEERNLHIQKEKAKELKKEFETELAGRCYAPVQFQNATVYMWVKDPKHVTPEDIQFNEKFKDALNELLPKSEIIDKNDPIYIAGEELRTGINHYTGEKLKFWEKLIRVGTIVSSFSSYVFMGIAAGKMQSAEYANVPKVSKITKNGKTYSLKRNKRTGKSFSYKKGFNLKINNLDDFVNNPQEILQNITPSELYDYLVQNGYKPQTLSKGSNKGIPFEKGGGFKIIWGGDRILQYHPTGKHHGGVPYYKISSGPTGTLRFDLNGNLIE